MYLLVGNFYVLHLWPYLQIYFKNIDLISGPILGE